VAASGVTTSNDRRHSTSAGASTPFFGGAGSVLGWYLQDYSVNAGKLVLPEAANAKFGIRPATGGVLPSAGCGRSSRCGSLVLNVSSYFLRENGVLNLM
jgi:hypothetical protein